MSRTPEDWPDDEYDDEEPQLRPTARATAQQRSSVEELTEKVKLAQGQLLDLQRQQEQIERQKRELEELSRKQGEFEQGRREILEKLTRGLVVLERQESEVKREAEQLSMIRSGFSDQLQAVESIQPQDWPAGELEPELTRALAIVDQANTLYSQSRARLEALRAQSSVGPDVNAPLEAPDGYAADMYEGPRPFGEIAREGFAYFLPMMIFFILLTVGVLAYLAYLENQPLP